MLIDVAADQYKIMKDFVGFLGKLKFGHFTDCLPCQFLPKGTVKPVDDGLSYFLCLFY